VVCSVSLATNISTTPRGQEVVADMIQKYEAMFAEEEKIESQEIVPQDKKDRGQLKGLRYVPLGRDTASAFSVVVF